MRKDRLGISLVSNLIAMFVSLGVSFFLTRYLIGSLGKEAYSFFPLANNFVNYMTIVSIALNSMASRFITVSMGTGDIEKSKGYFSSVFFANIILCVILVVPMIVIICFLDRFLDIPIELVGEIRILFSLIFISLLIQLVFSVFGVATFAKERMDLYAYQSIVNNILRAGLYIILFKVFPSSIVIMGIVTMILAIYNGVVSLYFSKRLMPEYRIDRRCYNKSYVVELVSSGCWNSLNSVGVSLMQTTMLLIANVMVSASEAADLSIVQTLPNLMTTIISTVFGVLLPRIANVYSRENNS
nr:MATE family efflux transporter [Paludibacteraceae bacterium]